MLELERPLLNELKVTYKFMLTMNKRNNQINVYMVI